MREQAGPDHFRNGELSQGRDEMRVERARFESQRAGFVSAEFEASRARFRSGRTRPDGGWILGSSSRDPDAVRALLVSSVLGSGVPLAASQPVLAQLLPAFQR